MVRHQRNPQMRWLVLTWDGRPGLCAAGVGTTRRTALVDLLECCSWLAGGACDNVRDARYMRMHLVQMLFTEARDQGAAVPASAVEPWRSLIPAVVETSALPPAIVTAIVFRYCVGTNLQRWAKQGKHQELAEVFCQACAPHVAWNVRLDLADASALMLCDVDLDDAADLTCPEFDAERLLATLVRDHAHLEACQHMVHLQRLLDRRIAHKTNNPRHAFTLSSWP